MDLFDILAKASMRLSTPKSQIFTNAGYTVIDALEAFWESDLSLSAGDVIDVRGQNGDSGDIDVDFTRTTFAVTKDS